MLLFCFILFCFCFWFCFYALFCLVCLLFFFNSLPVYFFSFSFLLICLYSLETWKSSSYWPEIHFHPISIGFIIWWDKIYRPFINFQNQLSNFENQIIMQHHPPTQHQSFFRNLSPLFIFIEVEDIRNNLNLIATSLPTQSRH